MEPESESVDSLVSHLNNVQLEEIRPLLSQRIYTEQERNQIISLVESDPRNKRIFITGLPRLRYDETTLKEMLREYFIRFGAIEDIMVNKNEIPPHDLIGVAFITFQNRVGAFNALRDQVKEFDDGNITCHQSAL